MLALLLAANMGALREVRSAPEVAAAKGARGIGVLFTAPLLLAVLFFVGLSMFGHGISSFGVSSLEMSHPGDLTAVTMVLSAFLFASPPACCSVAWVADRSPVTTSSSWAASPPVRNASS